MCGETMKLILYNGKIKSEDSKFYEAIFINNEYIEAIGTNEEILQLRDNETKIMDMEGRLVLPGFNDSHMHLLLVGYNYSQIDYGNTKSIKEAIEKSKSFISDKSFINGQWIQCFGWNEENWEEKRTLTRYDLDQISDKTPIVAIRVCTHTCALNTPALELLGYNKGTDFKYPEEVITDGNNMPTGLVHEMLPEVFENMPRASVKDIKKMLLNVTKIASEKGITSVQTDDFECIPGHCMVEIAEAYKELAENDQLPVRVYEQCRILNQDMYDKFVGNGFTTGMGNDIFRLGPLKTFCDGSLGSRTAWLKEPYADNPETTGISCYRTKELYKLVERAHLDEMSVAIHCIGDAAAEQAVSVIESVIDKYPDKNVRHGIIHAQILTDELIKRISKSKIIAYLQPVFIEYDMHIAESRIGRKRLENSYNYRKLFDNNICIPFGTDSPVEDFAPVNNLYCVTTGKDFNGEPEEGWHKEKCLTLDEALKCYSEYSAYASFCEDRKGKLLPGYLSDITVMNEDLYEIKSEDIKNSEVYMTIMNGKIRYKKHNQF